MATSRKKTTIPPSARTTPAQKTVAVATKKAAPIPAKKVSAPKTEKPTSKQAATAKSAPKKSVKEKTVAPEERYHMIATAAYFRAQQRGFVCCCEKQDWISAEAEIDAMLND
ncbi:MAG: DUF2934 domain-containing protein [Gallionella sp.]